MFCTKCGNKANAKDLYCSSCGEHIIKSNGLKNTENSDAEIKLYENEIEPPIILKIGAAYTIVWIILAITALRLHGIISLVFWIPGYYFLSIPNNKAMKAIMAVAIAIVCALFGAALSEFT